MPAIRATYRLQIRGDTDLDRATELLPYLDRLGVSHVYAAPLTRAAPGSQHGYDVCSFDEIDPAIGGEAAFERFAEALRLRGMGLLLDFVPNHMAASVENPWWRSVLEWGPTSPHADFFDIDWSARAGATPGKVLVPVLGDQYDAVLDRGELRLGVDEGTGRPEVRYWEKRFPVTPESYPLLLGEAAAEPGGQVSRERVAAAVETANADRERLHLLLEAQHYRLAHWRTATFSLNYRRFFDINELVGLRVDRPQVFDAAHAFVLRLIAEGKVHGLRIDHVDGLRDPVGYLHRLRAATREAAGRDIPVYVEKILGPDEDLRTDWPVQGTTGYEIANAIGGHFVDPEAEEETTETYAALTGAETDFEAAVEEAKRFVLARLFSGELDALAQRAARIAAESPETRDVTEGALREALIDLIVAFPVYRSYVVTPPAEGADGALLRAVFDAAAEICPEEAATALQFLRAMLLEGKTAAPVMAGEFVMRLQQLTGPVMAKALEDTAFYRYQRFVALNEVGGEPGVFGTPPHVLHEIAARRQAAWPHGLTAGSTHDTKFGEDLRARLGVLSEIPAEWRRVAEDWMVRTEALTAPVGEAPAPEPAMRYRFFQMLVGAWPPALEADDAEGLADLRARLRGAMEKTIREAKERTRWTAQDPEYETAVDRFVADALDPAVSADFLGEVRGFVRRIAPLGAINGLAQATLRMTLPGIPDVYQGAESWCLNLVDPDNRRPIDFDALSAQLAESEGEEPGELLAHWEDGAVKQRLTAALLRLRRARFDLFDRGAYLPLEVAGQEAGPFFGFARVLGEEAVVVVVPRLLGRLLGGFEGLRPQGGDLSIALPDGLQGRAWRSELASVAEEEGLPLAAALGRFPIAVFTAGEPDSRT